MTKRKSLSKKIRFEVFKRDSFTCQYCGAKAPDEILEVDHINPISKGGDNEIMNLITSCFSCNRGKSDREISDDSIVAKQRKQIEELNIRRQQLEMMLEWRDGLRIDEEYQCEKCINYFNSLWQHSILSENLQIELRGLVKKFGLIKIMDSIDICYKQYFIVGKSEDENFNFVFAKIGSVAHVAGKPSYERKIAYIRGIIRNKFGGNMNVVSICLKNWYNKFNEDGLDDLRVLASGDYFNSYGEFVDYLNEHTHEN